MAAATSRLTMGSVFKNSNVRWAATGWLFFVAENAVLSENRALIIQQLGDEGYHAFYGTCSTLAMASIGYARYRIRQTPIGAASALPLLWKRGAAAPVVNVVASWVALTVGLAMASQSLPKLQVPVGFASDAAAVIGSDELTASSSTTAGPAPPPTTTTNSSSWKLQVRCPFDFADGKQHNDTTDVRGRERITRHPGFWSFGLASMGMALLQPTLPLAVWWMGPATVAWMGGSHTDSRFRRNMGGSLDPHYDSQTSNIPFVAMLTGKQGSVSQAFANLANEIKPLNALIATFAVTVFVVSRGRVRVP